MAATHLSPAVHDFLDLKACSALFKDTDHPVSVSTLRRWIKDYQPETTRIRGTLAVSYSDILVLHRDLVLHREGAAGKPD